MMTLLGSSLGLCRLLLSFVSHTPPFTYSFLPFSFSASPLSAIRPVQEIPISSFREMLVLKRMIVH